MRRQAAAAVAVTIAALAWAAAAGAATIAVTTRADVSDPTPDGTCDTGGACSLREAIQEANGGVGPFAGPDEIALPAGRYELRLAGSGEDAGATGDLDVASPITILGAAAAATILDANGLDRVLDVLGPGSLTLRDATVEDGASPGFTAGGGIRSVGTLVLQRVAVVDNRASGSGGSAGGGIHTTGTATLTDVLIARNSVTDDAGGGLGVYGGSALLTNVTVSGNRSNLSPAGVMVAALGSAVFRHVTVTANVSVAGTGGIEVVGSLSTIGSVIAGNGADCTGTAPITSFGGNLLGAPGGCTVTGSTSTDLPVGTDPGLGPLADNGGPFATHAPVEGSALRDRVAACPDLPGDARGGARPQGGGCDVGAVEAGALANLRTTLVAAPATLAPGGQVVALATVANVGRDAMPGASLALDPGGATVVAGGSTACTGTGPVTCPLGRLDPGASVAVVVVVSPVAAGALTLVARAAGAVAGADPADDAASAVVGVGAPGATDATAPVVALPKGPLAASRRGAVVVAVGCPASETRCTGVVRLAQGKRVLAWRLVTAAGGTSARATLSLPGDVRAALAARRSAGARLVADVVDAAGNRRTTTSAVRLVAPARR